MILEHLTTLNQKHVVLASASPRRALLLRQIGLTSFEVVPSRFLEGLDKQAFGGPAGYAKETAKCKALDVANTARHDGRIPDLIIGADTVVEIDGLVLEKPKDATDATSMLRRMSGRQHAVHTGLVLICPSRSGKEPFVQSASTTTLVDFADLSDKEIAAYTATGEPFDKAGAYGAQGPAGVWIKSLHGCFFNVMGLPLYNLAAGIKALLDTGRL